MGEPRGQVSCAVCVLLGSVLIAGCVAVRAPDSQPPGQYADATLDQAEGSALLLLMADQLLFEPFAVRHIFRHHPVLHERLAVTLGRVGDPRGLPYLESLLEDPVTEVRRAAAFGLGQLGDEEAYPHLLGALGDRDREVGRLSVESLVRIGVPLEKIEPALGVLSEAEIRQRLLPVLYRFTPDEVHRVHSDLVARLDPDVGLDMDLSRWLFYALARSGDVRGLPTLRLGLESQDPWLRGWAARSLGRLGDRSDLDRLRPLLESADAGVVIHALRAAGRLIDAGRGAPPPGWLIDLERLIEDDRSSVRLTALESAGNWTRGSSLAGRLRRLAAENRGRAAELALLSLARAGDIEAEQLILRAAASRSPSMRGAAATAAVVTGFDAVVERLRVDSEPAVRISALSALFEHESRTSGALGSENSRAEVAAREALLDPDPGLRTVALEWLASHPAAPLDEIMLALSTATETRMPDLLVSGSSALAARAAANPLERGASIAALERLAENSDYVVRRAAGEALASLGSERPPLGSIVSNRALRAYREISSRLKTDRWIELVTERGRIVIELATREAPLTCITFMQLAQAGFFDGLTFHRVVPDFVAQGGDPRADGWGGPGFSLRDENSRMPFERGVVGMARSGTHTAGSQFFLTLSAQPHLNGSYTAFGRVVAGDERLDSIEQGDLILSLREVATAESD